MRDPEMYPEHLKYLLNIVTLSETPEVVGSSAYFIHKYPSDVDVFEKVRARRSKKDSSLFYAHEFQTIIKRLLVNYQKVFITDFKAGGKHWKPYEMFNTDELREAIETDEVVKLDTAMWIDGRYQAVEVFYSLSYEDGTYHPLGSYTKNLLEDVRKYSTEEFYSPLKLAKRLWALSRVTDCYNMLEAINPLLGSDVAALNQVVADVETLNLILPYELEDEQITNIISEVMGFHKRLINHSENNELHKLVDEAFPIWKEWKATGVFDKEKMSTIINGVKNHLLDEIKGRANHYMKKVADLNISCRIA